MDPAEEEKPTSPVVLTLAAVALLAPVVAGVVWVFKSKPVEPIDTGPTEEQFAAFNTDEVLQDDGRPRVVKRVQFDYSRPHVANSGEIRGLASEAGDHQRAVRRASGRGDASGGGAGEGAQGIAGGASDQDMKAASGFAGFDFTRPKVAKDVGARPGILSQIAGKIVGHPKLISAVFSNQYIVDAFMSRDSVKNASSSAGALKDYMERTGAVKNWLNHPAVQAGLNNPDAMKAFMSSGMMARMMETPAGQEIMQNPQVLGDVMEKNPELGQVLANPNVLQGLAVNPQAMGALAGLGGGMPR